MYKLLKAGKSNALSTERALKLADVGFVFDASGFRRGKRTNDDQPMAPATQQVPFPQVITQQQPPQVMVQQPTQVVQDPYEHQIHLNPHIQNAQHIQNLQNIGLMPPS